MYPTLLHALRLLLLFSLVALVGCGDDDDDDDTSGAPMSAIDINPSAVNITVSDSPQTVVLSASNGNGEYTWTVSNPELGTIEPRGTSVLYESTIWPGENIINVIDSGTGGGSVIITQR